MEAGRWTSEQQFREGGKKAKGEKESSLVAHGDRVCLQMDEPRLLIRSALGCIQTFYICKMLV